MAKTLLPNQLRVGNFNFSTNQCHLDFEVEVICSSAWGAWFFLRSPQSPFACLNWKFEEPKVCVGDGFSAYFSFLHSYLLFWCFWHSTYQLWHFFLLWSYETYQNFNCDLFTPTVTEGSVIIFFDCGQKRYFWFFTALAFSLAKQ